MYSTFQPFDYADWRIWFYLAAQLLGGIGLTLLLVTMLLPTSKRRSVVSYSPCSVSPAAYGLISIP